MEITEWKSSDFFLPKWWKALNWELSWLVFFRGVNSLVKLPLSLASLRVAPLCCLLSDTIPAITCPFPPQTHTPNWRLQGPQSHDPELSASCVQLCWILSCDLLLRVKPWRPVLALVFRVPFSLIHCFCRQPLNFNFAFTSRVGMPHTSTFRE